MCWEMIRGRQWLGDNYLSGILCLKTILKIFTKAVYFYIQFNINSSIQNSIKHLAYGLKMCCNNQKDYVLNQLLKIINNQKQNLVRH